MKPRPPPYDLGALEPYISRTTLSLHYNLQCRYAERFEQARPGYDPFVEVSRCGPVLAQSSTPRDLANAAQVVNHDLYWRSMRPNGGGAPPPGTHIAQLVAECGGWSSALRARLISEGLARMGSGWLWLMVDTGPVALRVLSTPDYATPQPSNLALPLLCCDLWEHAYYLDHYYDRETYLMAFCDYLLNWEQAESVLLDQS